MTHHDLNAQFTETGTTPAGFIAWAASFGVTVSHPTVSRHRAGTQGITAPWEIVYRCFFVAAKEYKKNLKNNCQNT